MDASMGHEASSLERMTSGRTETAIAAGDKTEIDDSMYALGDTLFSDLNTPTPSDLTPTQPANLINAGFNIRSAPVILENIDLNVQVAAIDPEDIPTMNFDDAPDDRQVQTITRQALG